MTADFSLEAVARFLNHEGRLLDQRKFADWLGLFDDDANYWIPLQRDQSDPRAIPSIVYEDKVLLAMRVERMMHPKAHSATPTPRTLHVIGVPDIAPHASDKASCTVTTSQLIIESFEGSQRLYAAECRHVLRATQAGLRIASKRIDLIDCDQFQGLIRSIL
jgi:3-phenylpropionate/cinnamic acid dioxygenase small subunit